MIRLWSESVFQGYFSSPFVFLLLVRLITARTSKFVSMMLRSMKFFMLSRSPLPANSGAGGKASGQPGCGPGLNKQREMDAFVAAVSSSTGGYLPGSRHPAHPARFTGHGWSFSISRFTNYIRTVIPSEEWLALQNFHILTSCHNGWSINISRYTSHTKMVGFLLCPDSRALRLIGPLTPKI